MGTLACVPSKMKAALEKIQFEIESEANVKKSWGGFIWGIDFMKIEFQDDGGEFINFVTGRYGYFKLAKMM